ncbi:DUF4258 domain-containing protein [Dehalococcoidia bacterium]|nr:DUF4258 domain-containing protein [Dehalococcoidia bacterium]
MSKIREIQLLVRSGLYYLTEHADDEAAADGFDIYHVEEGILTGKTRRTWPKEGKYEVVGTALDGRPVGIVCRITKAGKVRVITVYEAGETMFKLDSFPDNPIVKPQDLGLTWHEKGELKTGAVFNGGAEVFQDKIMLMPRCQQGYSEGTYIDERTGIERTCLENYVSEIWPLVSEDGVRFTRFQNPVIRGDGTDHLDFTYGIEDIRIVKYGQRYLLVGCGKLKAPFKGAGADRIAVYSTGDFVNITYHGIVEPFDSRNAIPFSEPVNGRHYMLLRFHPNIHLDLLEVGIDQLLNPSRHVEHWQRIYDRRSRNLLLEAGRYAHEKEKIGPIYIPSAPYELRGNDQYPVDVPAVVFPVGALSRENKLILYAGAGDKYIILLSCNLDSLVDYLWERCRPAPRPQAQGYHV